MMVNHTDTFGSLTPFVVWFVLIAVVAATAACLAPESFIRPCSHCYSGAVIRHKFVPVQLSRNIGARSH